MKFLTLIVEWSLENRVIVMAATVLFFVFGLDSVRKLKMDAIPDVTTIQVQVITSAPALSPLEIEQYVTFPVERAMAGIPHLEEVRSISRYGLSVVTVVFKDDMNIYLARQLVGERLSDAVNNIPKGYGTPSMGPISTGLGEIYQFTLSSRTTSLMDLTTYLNWYINPILKTVPGVVEVNTFGGNVKQYQIILNMERMQSLGIVMTDVIDALEKNNASMGGGYIEHNKEHFVIVASGLVGSLDDLGKIFLGNTKEGTPISLSMIADLKFGIRLRLGATTKDGEGQVVGAMALMLMKENSLQVSQAVHNKLEEIKKTLPEGIIIETYYDRSEMVKITIKTVLINLLEGAILVILVLFLLLGSIRAGLVIAITIPFAMLFAIVIMRITDSPGNLMSMGAIDFGLIVDGAVIIVENAVRRLSMAIKEKGSILTREEKIETIKQATIEVRKATIFGETIIAIVYLPVLSLHGVEGKMFIPMAQTVLYALIKFYYIPILDTLMNAKNQVLSVAVVSIVLSFVLFANLGAEFMPELDEGSLLLEVARLPSVSLSESIETGRRIEKTLKEKFPELLHAVSKTGSPDIATDPMGIERTDIYLQLKPKEEWRFPREQLMQALADDVEESVPEVAVSVSQPIKMRTNELIAGIRSDIGVKIFGDDIKTLREIGDKTSHELRKIKGVVDLKIEQLGGLNYLRIKPKRESLARYGVNIQDINQVTEILSSGYMAGSVFEGNKRFDITIKTNREIHFNLEEIRSLPVKSNSGIAIPLGDLADVYIESGPVQISHQNQYRRMIVEFNVRGRDMMSVVAEANELLSKNIPLPVGYRFEFGGKYENYISARNTLMIVVPLTLCLILFLLWLAFDFLFGEYKFICFWRSHSCSYDFSKRSLCYHRWSFVFIP